MFTLRLIIILLRRYYDVIVNLDDVSSVSVINVFNCVDQLG